MHDPPVRTDGRCARTGCNKKLPRAHSASRYAGGQLELDPFCSTRCCRVYHGALEPETQKEEASRKRGERQGQEAANNHARAWNKPSVARAIATKNEKWHGTSRGYKVHRCRCPKCQAANTAKRQREREQRAARKAAATP